jgi:hypothetical protein
VAYDTTDPRSQLHSGSKTILPVEDYAGAESIEFHTIPPTETGPGFKSWYGRGQHFIICYSEVEPGAVLDRDHQADEYMAFFPDREIRADIDTADGNIRDISYQLAIIPPGSSRIRINAGNGVVMRVFSALSKDLAAKCYNAASYETPHPNVAPFAPWPNPPAGFKLRVYPIAVPPAEGRFGVLYRSTNLMINLFPVADEPRDPNKMSPHHHDDFEQCSLTLKGDYMHFIRWPWTVNKAIWREDAKLRCSAPSITIIPPPAIHTSQALPPAPCHLIDIFGPPRLDFSLKPGWVLNADDYPMPS